MPGGTITVTADTYEQLGPLTQRILCWALTDRHKIRLDTQGRLPAVVIPEEVIAGKGALITRRAGTDLVSGYVASSHVVVAGQGPQASGLNVNTCLPAVTNQPIITAITQNQGGVPRQVRVAYANVAAAGVVNINWGDGQVTNGAAESGTSDHVYANYGTYKITITDASDATAFTENWITVTT